MMMIMGFQSIAVCCYFFSKHFFSSRNAIETIEKFPKLFGRAELHGQRLTGEFDYMERAREFKNDRYIKITIAIIISSGFSPFSPSDLKF